MTKTMKPVLVCVSEISKRFMAPVTRDTYFSMCQRYVNVSRLRSHVTPVYTKRGVTCDRSHETFRYLTDTY
jgi:hypothetical protein